jgi:hypothetical protein
MRRSSGAASAATASAAAARRSSRACGARAPRRRAAAAPPRSLPRPAPIVNIRFVGQLGRLANNLNQLTKLVHQGRTSPLLLPRLKAVLSEERKVGRRLIGLDPVARGAAKDGAEVDVEGADARGGKSS